MTILSSFIAILIFAAACFSQASGQISVKKAPAGDSTSVQRSTPAYAEVLLRRTELGAELESLLVEYTEDYPKVAEIRFTLITLQKEGERILAVKSAESAKLTLALGKLMVRKSELETDFWRLLKTYKDEHPDVKRAKRKVEIYESAIKEIL